LGKVNSAQMTSNLVFGLLALRRNPSNLRQSFSDQF